MIGRAIDSIRLQTVQPLEILVVDDGSKAENAAALEQYRSVARIILLEKNGGAPTARNEGVAQAQGEFIAFLDDDDEWIPEKLALQLNIFGNDPSLHAVVGPMTIHYQDDSEELLRSHSAEIMTVESALEGTPAMLQTLLIRTDCIRQLGGFDRQFSIVDDWEFWVRFTAEGFKAHYMAQPLARLERCDMERLTRNWQKYTTEEMKVVDKHQDLYERVRGRGAGRLQRSRILRRAGIRKGRVVGRLAYACGCLLGGEWGSLSRLITTARMAEVPYKRA